MAAGKDVRELLLQVDASVELARRNLGQLARQVETDSKKMDASLGKVDGAVDRMGATFGKLSGMAAGLLASVGVGTFINIGRQALQFGDDLEAAASQAGMGVERYQTLKGALRTLEVDAGKADKIFKMLQVTLGDVQNGADNAATKALDRLGISADIMSGKVESSDELLDALAAAAKRAGSQAQFTADLVDIFGKKVGVELAAALADGGAALHKGEEDIRSFGLVLTEEMVDRLATANESIDRFTEKTSYAFAMMASDVIGSIERIAVAIQSIPNMSPGTAALGFYSSLPAWMRTGSPRLGVAAGVVGAGLSLAAGGKDPGPRDILAEVMSPAGFLRQNLEMSDRARRTPRAGRIAKPSRKTGGRGSSKKPPKKSGPTAAEQRIEEDEYDFKLNRELSVPPALETLLSEEPTAALARLRAEVEKMAAVTFPDVGDMLTIEDQRRIQGFVESFQQDMSRGLAEALVYGDDLGDVLVSSIQRAAAALIESGLLNLLSGGKEGTSFTTLAGNVIGSLLGGGKKGSSGSGGSLPKRAKGGPVWPGQTYLVGEEGPEPFIPRIPGIILPHGYGGGGGGTSISLSVNAPGATAETVAMIRRELANAAPMLINAAKGATIRQLSRPRLG